MKRKFFRFLPLIIILVLTSVFFIGCKDEVAIETTAAETIAAETTEAVETTIIETTAAEREAVTIEVWTGASDDHTYYKILLRAAEIVKEKYNINANVIAKGVAGYRESLIASALSQSGPDVIQLWGGTADCITQGKQGLFLPLNDIMTEDDNNLIGLGGFTDPDTGDIYELPYAINFVCMAYNKSYMEQAGVDYESFPLKLNYEEFITVCEKLKSAEITPFFFTNKEGYFGGWWHGFFLTTYFDKLADFGVANTTKPTYKEPFISFAKNWKDFLDKGYYVEGGNTISVSDAWGQLPNGDAAIAFCSPGLIDMYYEGMKENVGVMEWPSMGDGELGKQNPVFGEGLGIGKWSNYPEEAMLFIQTVVYEKEIADTLAKGGNPPVSPKYKMSDFTIENPLTLEYFEEHDKLPTYYDGMGLLSKESAETIYKFCNLMLTGDITIEEYAEELDAVLK